MDLYALATRHVKTIVDLLNQHVSTNRILTAYSREKYNEFRKAPEICRMMTSCNSYGSSFRRSKEPSNHRQVGKSCPIRRRFAPASQTRNTAERMEKNNVFATRHYNYWKPAP